MQEKQSFDQVLNSLRESGPSDATLYKLSNLPGTELRLLAETWPSLSVEHRQQIASRLLEIGEADFETDFCEVFRVCLTDPDPQVRTAAIEGLWEVEDVVLIRPLIHMLQQDTSTVVREAAAISLSRFALLAELGDLPPGLGDLVWDSLWNAVHNPQEDISVRRRAIESLAYFDRPEVTQVIERAYQDEEAMMRISAVFAMGRSADERWSDRVMAELDQDDPQMRYEAARACGSLHVAEAVPILSKMVADPDLEVKLAAVWALGQIGGPEAQRVLEICSEQGDEGLQDAAAEALEELDFGAGAFEFPLWNADGEEEDEFDWDEDDDDE
jgi:HEAT repeat protein